MKSGLGALIGVLVCTGISCAAEDDRCDTARDLVEAGTPLPRVAAAIERQHALNIAVFGSASSMLPGAADAAYPARLKAALAERLPGVTVNVTSYAKSRLFAADMVRDFPRVLAGDKPALIVWQTGTVDAMRGVDLEQFRANLDAGIERLHAGGADVILMNMQYSPRTETMIAETAYADDLRWIAIQQDVPLFDRFAIMRHWSELGIFDLTAPGKSAEMAVEVHRCIGRLLADLVVNAAKIGEPEK